jgi:EmrB/QacA subfamily drug resistance transporter
MRRPAVVLALLCTAQFMVTLDVTIVAVALPAIRDGLGMDAATLQWVISAYTLTFGGLLVPAGRAADRLGRRRVFVLGVALFTAASLACGLARAPGLLLAARALQGAGAAMVAPAALALLAAAFPDGPPRARAFAVWTAAAAGGGASGWVLGGLLADGPGWPWVFLANVPVGLAAILAARPLLRESRDERPGPLDLPGGLALTAALALLVLGLTRTDPIALAAAALAGAVFVAIERRAARPLLPARLLRSRRFATATGAALAITASTSPAMLLAILYQQEELGRSALETGLACVPLNVAVIAGSVLGPAVLARAGERRAMAAGLVAVAAGAVALAASVAAGTGIATLLPAFVLMGAGLGCAAVASTTAGIAVVRGDDQGVASGVLNAAAQIGTAVGFAVLLSVAEATTAVAGIAGAAAVALLAAAATALGARRRAGVAS